jgi:hypothetical protein
MKNTNDKLVEFIIYIDTENADELRHKLEAYCSIVHIFSPHILVLVGKPSVVQEVGAIKGVIAPLNKTVYKAISSTFTQEEKLFVSAWLQSKEKAKGVRSGDGLDWDANDMFPPDITNPKEK